MALHRLTPPASVKLRYLDGLRGLAALIVVVDHFSISFFQAATDASIHSTYGWLEWAVQTTPLHILVSGNFSVCVFFILSGIVLSAGYFRKRDRSLVTAAMVKRYPRLALPVLGCVVLAFTLMSLHAFANVSAAHVTGSTWLPGFWRFQPNLLNAIYQGLVGVFVAGWSSYNTVLWTMQIELIGSFLVFGLLLGVGQFRYRYWVYLALGLVFITTYYVSFIIGVALCDSYFRGGRQSTTKLRAPIWIPLLLLSWVLASVPVGALQGTAFGFAAGWMLNGMSLAIPAHVLGALGLIVALLYTPSLQAILIKKPLLYLGKLSFGLYLTHLYIIGSFSSYAFTKIAPMVGYNTGFILTLIPSLLLIWLVAHSFTKLVDEPAIRLSHRLVPAATAQPSHSK